MVVQKIPDKMTNIAILDNPGKDLLVFTGVRSEPYDVYSIRNNFVRSLPILCIGETSDRDIPIAPFDFHHLRALPHIFLIVSS